MRHLFLHRLFSLTLHNCHDGEQRQHHHHQHQLCLVLLHLHIIQKDYHDHQKPYIKMIIFTTTDDDQDWCCLRPVTQSVNPAGVPLLMSLKWTKTAPHRDTNTKYKCKHISRSWDFQHNTVQQCRTLDRNTNELHCKCIVGP